MTDIALDEKLLPCPHCGGKEHEIGVGDDGHSVTCHSVSCRASTGLWHTREQAIAAWNRRASPSQVAPANAMVVERCIEIALDRLEIDYDGDEPFIRSDSIESAVEAITAAIGAGGQAVAWMRKWAFDGIDVMAMPKKERPAGWMLHEVTRHQCLPDDVPLSALSQPHPADERVVETLDGATLIAAERRRQVEGEGWTPEHDATHTNGELAIAAACYALNAADNSDFHAGIDFWPWSDEWWKPSGDPIRDLEKAGALIAAEIDRLKRSVNRTGIIALSTKEGR